VHLYEGASARSTHADRLRVTKANLLPRELVDACVVSKRISAVAARLRVILSIASDKER